MTPPRGVEDAAPYKDGPKPPHNRAHSGQHPLTLPPPRRGRACPARNFAPPAVTPSIAHPFPKTPDPATLFPPTTPQFVPANRRHPNIHLAQTSPSNFVEKIKKTCKNLLTKVILLAIIIKLSREPSPRRQPLEPLPTACTPFFEENFFKKLSENLLTNERI